MDQHRWPAKDFRYLYLENVDTQWLRKSNEGKLTMKYGKNSGESETAKVTKKEAMEIDTDDWREKNGS